MWNIYFWGGTRLVEHLLLEGPILVEHLLLEGPMLVEHVLLEGPMLVESTPLSAAYTCYIPLAFREYRVDLKTCLGNPPRQDREVRIGLSLGLQGVHERLRSCPRGECILVWVACCIKLLRELLSRRHPFGSACFFLEETPLPKFEPRSRLGVFSGYGRLESYVVLDYEHYVQSKGEARIVKTRDVRFMPELRFPFLELREQILIQCIGLLACLSWCLMTLGRRLMPLANAPCVVCGPRIAKCPARLVCPAIVAQSMISHLVVCKLVVFLRLFAPAVKSLSSAY